MKRTRLYAVLAAVARLSLPLRGHSIPTAEENAKAKWADVQNYYSAGPISSQSGFDVRAAAAQEATSCAR